MNDSRSPSLAGASPYLRRRRIVHHEDAVHYIKRRDHPLWLFDVRRREEILASDAAFLVSLLIVFVLSGFIGYFDALWMGGLV
jgi:hypothetical protein